MKGQTRQRKGKVTASPRAKAKVQAKTRENIQEKGTTTKTRLDGSPNEDGQRTLGDFGYLNVTELNLSVMSKRMMILRLPRLDQLMCFAFKSAIVLRWIRRN